MTNMQEAATGTTSPVTSTETSTSKPKRERKPRAPKDNTKPPFNNEATVIAHLGLTVKAATNKLTAKDHKAISDAVQPFIKPLRKPNNTLASALYYVGWKHRKLAAKAETAEKKSSRKSQQAAAQSTP